MSEAVFKAIAEPRRRSILRLVSGEPKSVNEIAKHFDVTQQAISQHLQVLKEAGLLAVRAEAQRRLYMVRQDGLADVREFLEELWPDRLEKLKRAVESDAD